MSELYHGYWRFASNIFKPVYGEAWSDEDLDNIVDAEQSGQQVPDMFIQVGVFGKSLSDFLRDKLRERGFYVKNQYASDWAHLIELENKGPEAVQIACMNEDRPDRHSVQVRVTVPLWVKLLKKSSLSNVTTRLETEITSILETEELVFELEYID